MKLPWSKFSQRSNTYGNQIPLRSVKKRKTFFNVKNSVIEVFTHKWDSLVKAYCVDYYACYLLFIIFENKTCKVLKVHVP